MCEKAVTAYSAHETISALVVSSCLADTSKSVSQCKSDDTCFQQCECLCGNAVQDVPSMLPSDWAAAWRVTDQTGPDTEFLGSNEWHFLYSGASKTSCATLSSFASGGWITILGVSRCEPIGVSSVPGQLGGDGESPLCSLSSCADSSLTRVKSAVRPSTCGSTERKVSPVCAGPSRGREKP